MATHNGSKYLEEQIASILGQLSSDDELVIVDDASSDTTVDIVRSFADSRIRLYENPHNLGYVRTFERGLTLSTGDHVFLSDQDDVWPAGRVGIMQRALAQSAVVAGNVSILNGPARISSPFGAVDWTLHGRPSQHPLPWIARLAASNAPYFGSAMAVRADLLALALPFPPSARETHDAWLALLGLMTRSMCHLPDRVILRRIHGENTSGTRRSWPVVLRGRVLFLGMCRDAWLRTRASSCPVRDP